MTKLPLEIAPRWSESGRTPACPTVVISISQEANDLLVMRLNAGGFSTSPIQICESLLDEGMESQYFHARKLPSTFVSTPEIVPIDAPAELCQ